MAKETPIKEEQTAGVSSTVDAAQLRQMNVPVEAMLGAANGAVSGGLLATAVSAAYTAGKELTKNKEMRQQIGKLVMQNIKSTHFLPIVVATGAFAALGATVRFTRASSHNEWSERQYALLQQAGSHTERVEAAEAKPQTNSR